MYSLFKCINNGPHDDRIDHYLRSRCWACVVIGVHQQVVAELRHLLRNRAGPFVGDFAKGLLHEFQALVEGRALQIDVMDVSAVVQGSKLQHHDVGGALFDQSQGTHGRVVA